MSWTKKQLVEQAFSQIGLAAYVFDLSPDQLENALRLMDSMLATWNQKGIRLGYPLPSSIAASDIDQDSGVPDSANEAIYQNLALRIAPAFGKTPSIELKASAKAAYDAVLLISALPPEMQLPAGIPLGAGNRRWNSASGPFTPAPADPLLAGQDSAIDFD